MPKTIGDSANSQRQSSHPYDEGMDHRILHTGVPIPTNRSPQYLPNVPSLDYFNTLFDTCYEMPDMSNAFSTFAFTDAQQYHQPLDGSRPSAFLHLKCHPITVSNPHLVNARLDIHQPSVFRVQMKDKQLSITLHSLQINNST
jgi:hypothetical protein